MSHVRTHGTAYLAGLALATLVLILPLVPAQASLYEIELRPYDGSNLVCSLAPEPMSEPSPIQDTHTHSASNVVGSSSSDQEALSGLGYVGMKQTVSHRLNPGGWNRVFGTCSSARTIIDDLQVVGPPGQITASLNARISGKVLVDTLASRSLLRVTVSLRSTQGGPVATNSVEFDIESSSDIDLDIDQVINSGPLTFDSAHPLVAELEIEMSVIAGNVRGTASEVSIVDLLDQQAGYGFHFSETEVMTLPAGYTVNSSDGDVGNNMWGGTVPIEHHTWGQLKSLYR